MSPLALLTPVFVQVGLTAFLMVWMGHVRYQAVKSGAVKLKDVALRQPNWPVPVLRIANCYHNQFETPVLFYAVVAFIMITNQIDILMVLLAWGFVIARLIHAAIHTTQESVLNRFYIFLFGSTCLGLMWGFLLFKLILEALG